MNLFDKLEITKETHPEMPDWFDPILAKLRKMADALYNGLNNDITIEQNLNMYIEEMQITDSELTFTNPMKLKNRLNRKLKGCIICKCEQIKTGTKEVITPAPYVDWDATTSELTIYEILGITETPTGKQYRINLLVF
jgi:hypothetical protein